MQFIKNYIAYKRTKLSITQRKLGAGLSAYTVIGKIEREYKYPDKLTIDMIAQRLGIEKEAFEYYVSYQDYNLHQCRREILKNIELNKLGDALKLLETYCETTANLKSKLQKQFIQYAKVMIAEKQGETNLAQEWQQLILITNPDFNPNNIKELVFSDAEIYFIIKYASHLPPTEAKPIYLELLKFLTSTKASKSAQSKYHPQVVLKLAKPFMEGNKYHRVLTWCNQSIEYIRLYGNFNFFVEILELKRELLKLLNRFDEEYNVTIQWLDTLNSIYTQYNAKPVCQLNLFIFKNYYFVGDIIRNRRIMLGLSPMQLAEEICDIRTIYRLEHGKTNTKLYLIEKILKKLNLSGDLYNDRIPFVNLDTFTLSYNISRDINVSTDYEKIKRNIATLKSQVDMNNKINQQFILHSQIAVNLCVNEITDTEALAQLKDALELTVPLDKIFATGPKYFTILELSLIMNICRQLDELNQVDELLLWIGVVSQYYEDWNIYDVDFNSYATMYGQLSSILANKKDFIHGSQIAKILIKSCVDKSHCKNLNFLFYDLAWNYKESIINNLNKKLNPAEHEEYRKLLYIAKILSEIQQDKYLISAIQLLPLIEVGACKSSVD